MCAPITVADGVLYTGSTDGFLYALHAETGEIKWEFNSRESIATAPALSGQRLFFGNGRGVFALDSSSGAFLWKWQSDLPVESSPLLVGKRLFFGCDDRAVYCLSANEGKLLWRSPLGNIITAAPVSDGKRLYVGCLDKKFYALNLKNGKILWSAKTKGIISASAALDAERLYFGNHDGRVYCLRTKDGTSVWDKPVGAPVYAAPILVPPPESGSSSEAVLYILTRAGKLWALDLSQGETLWTYQSAGRAGVSLTADEEAVVFGSDDKAFYAVSPEGRLLARRYLPQWPFAVPAKAGEWLFVSGLDRHIRAYRLKAQPPTAGANTR